MARPGNPQDILQCQKMLRLFLLPRYGEFNSSKKKKKKHKEAYSRFMKRVTSRVYPRDYQANPTVMPDGPS